MRISFLIEKAKTVQSEHVKKVDNLEKKLSLLTKKFISSGLSAAKLQGITLPKGWIKDPLDWITDDSVRTSCRQYKEKYDQCQKDIRSNKQIIKQIHSLTVLLKRCKIDDIENSDPYKQLQALLDTVVEQEKPSVVVEPVDCNLPTTKTNSTVVLDSNTAKPESSQGLSAAEISTAQQTLETSSSSPVNSNNCTTSASATHTNDALEQTLNDAKPELSQGLSAAEIATAQQTLETSSPSPVNSNNCTTSASATHANDALEQTLNDAKPEPYQRLSVEEIAAAQRMLGTSSPSPVISNNRATSASAIDANDALEQTLITQIQIALNKARELLGQSFPAPLAEIENQLNEFFVGTPAVLRQTIAAEDQQNTVKPKVTSNEVIEAIDTFLATAKKCDSLPQKIMQFVTKAAFIIGCIVIGTLVGAVCSAVMTGGFDCGAIGATIGAGLSAVIAGKLVAVGVFSVSVFFSALFAAMPFRKIFNPAQPPAGPEKKIVLYKHQDDSTKLSLFSRPHKNAATIAEALRNVGQPSNQRGPSSYRAPKV